ncbi:MAG: catalase/peroxidase HPI [Bdellovibrionales bacterium]|nr:catalase/peroxidase HPI [Bdellovibrionales bacterium]
MGGKSNQFWWPNLVNLAPLRQHSKESNPYGEKFNYAKEFRSLHLDTLKKDIAKVLRTSQDWWPADYGHYGPFFIRMAWHSSGTYRVVDGRGGAGGGQQRFEPLNSWPDNANLDKARRLLWPIKKKYGRKLSWADLMVLAGNVSLEDMGFKTIGFAGGRTDDWEPDMVYWGPEAEFLGRHRQTKDGKLQKPLGATQMGLIYVNPEGPNGNPDPVLAGQAIREAFGRMAMDDEETVALIAGGHSFGKTHGAHKPSDCVGPEPAAASLEKQGLGWKNKCGTGKGKDTVTSGLEGAWTATPTQFSMAFLQFLFSFEWKKTKSPGGATQWIPTDEGAVNLVPDAHVKGKRHAPIMLTTDLALRFDPIYGKISKRFLENPKEFEKAFARAWFKLTHRDMGPRARYVGKDSPKEVFKWQDPVPARSYKTISAQQVQTLKSKILSSGLSTSELVKAAWAAASSFRGTDMRGGANGGRLRLAPQKDWQVNNPQELSKILVKLEKVQKNFNKSLGKGTAVSFADVVVLGGAAAIERAAKKAGHSVRVPVRLGRTDASQEQTDVNSFNELEPKADGFRNYFNKDSFYPPVQALVDKASLLNLTVPEMTVLVGGLRVLGANTDNSSHGVFTNRKGVLTNDFFVNLLDMSTKWEKSSQGMYKGVDRKTGKLKYTATPVDLVFGSSSELRAVAEVYAANDGQRQFVQDFVKAWTKVMQLDRFDLHH